MVHGRGYGLDLFSMEMISMWTGYDSHGTIFKHHAKPNLLPSCPSSPSSSRYVHQEVLLPGTSTVTEYLTFHAALRMPQQSPTEGSKQAVTEDEGGDSSSSPAAASNARRRPVPLMMVEASRAAARQRVFEVIHELGLSRVQDSLIGDAFVRGLSGQYAMQFIIIWSDLGTVSAI